MLPVEFQIVPMATGDYDEVLALWNTCEGVRAGETREEFMRILARNPEISTVIRRGAQLAAAVLCCHDGRRGYLYHVCVVPEFRKLGLGRILVERSLANLRAAGVSRCTIFVQESNKAGQAFWKQIGWHERDDLEMFAFDL